MHVSVGTVPPVQEVVHPASLVQRTDAAVHVDAAQVSVVAPTPPVTVSELHADPPEQLTVVLPSPPLNWVPETQLLMPEHATSTSPAVSPSTFRVLQELALAQVVEHISALPHVTVSLLQEALAWHWSEQWPPPQASAKLLQALVPVQVAPQSPPEHTSVVLPHEPMPVHWRRQARPHGHCTIWPLHCPVLQSMLQMFPMQPAVHAAGQGPTATHAPALQYEFTPQEPHWLTGMTAQVDVPLHVRKLHGSLWQVTGIPTHEPLLHVSPKVHAMPSLQAPVSCVTVHAAVPLQVRVVH
jgi:hypothetical protein